MITYREQISRDAASPDHIDRAGLHVPDPGRAVFLFYFQREVDVRVAPANIDERTFHLRKFVGEMGSGVMGLSTGRQEKNRREKECESGHVADTV